MKYIIVMILALISYGCATTKKCEINSLPPSPTHEEILAQEQTRQQIKKATDTLETWLTVVVNSIKSKGIEDVGYETKDAVCINKCEYIIIYQTIRFGAHTEDMYWMLRYANNTWEIRNLIPGAEPDQQEQ